MKQPPEAFCALRTNDPAIDAWAPIYFRNDDTGVRLGTFIRKHLCNSHKMAHGGVIAALADMAMGYAYALVCQRPQHGTLTGLVTSQIAVDYIAAVRLGAWLEFDTRVVFSGKTKGVVDCTATADGAIAARANAVFRSIAP